MSSVIKSIRSAPSLARKIYKTIPQLFSATTVTMAKISDSIVHDHKELEQFYNNIKNAKSNDEKMQWRNQFTWELARHSVGEELVVYPAFEKLLPNGKEMADKDRKEHASIKEHLFKFQDMKPEDPNFSKTLEALWTNLSTHIKEEEREDLPTLEKALDENDSEKMAKSFGRTKMFVPTRSHPSGPDKAPFENVVSFLTAPMDHLRDMFRKFPEDTKAQLPP
ncbi:HHE domain protein [Xylaria curta]|nr:HHE domain protein [Xylaria curta]